MATTKKEETPLKERYFEAVGRRKTSTARVRITKTPDVSRASFVINHKDMAAYFPTEEMRLLATQAGELAGAGAWSISARVSGGGIHAQAEAVRHGISRALVKYDEELRKKLKKGGLLKRDPRMKERKKFGFKKARKRAQWSKR